MSKIIASNFFETSRYLKFRISVLPPHEGMRISDLFSSIVISASSILRFSRFLAFSLKIFFHWRFFLVCFPRHDWLARLITCLSGRAHWSPRYLEIRGWKFFVFQKSGKIRLPNPNSFAPENNYAPYTHLNTLSS